MSYDDDLFFHVHIYSTLDPFDPMPEWLRAPFAREPEEAAQQDSG